MDYLSADTELQSARNEANGKPVANNTRLYRRGDGVIALTLHATDVVTFYRDGRIVLNSGGWRTVTTKDRIGYVVNVYSVKGEWYVDNPQPNDPRPEYPHREIDKPFEAIDPGPEPVKDPTNCIAGQSRTEPTEERHFIKRDELLDGEDFEDAGSGGGDYVWVTRPGEKTTYWGERAQRYQEERHADIPEGAVYEQCEHCRAFDARHDSWDEFMNGNRWLHPRGRGYRQMTEYLERFGSREAWMQAYKEEGREVRAGQVAFREWEARNRTPFFDGIELDADGRVTNAPETGEVEAFERAVADEKERIAKFIKLARETLANGMPMPSSGDCWYCMMRTNVEEGERVEPGQGDALGDAFNDHDHLRQHMEEGYVVPSLLTNAMLEAGYKPVGVYMLLDMDQDTQTMGGKDTADWSNSYDRGPYSTMARALRKYLTKRLVPTNAKEVTNA